MLEELKLVIGLLQGVTDSALWVVGAIAFVYTLITLCITIVSYNVLILVINKSHDAYKYYATEKPIINRVIQKNVVEKLEVVNLNKFNDLGPMLITMDDTPDMLILQLKRIRNRSCSSSTSTYIHEGDVVWLRDAISMKIESDKRLVG